LNRLGSSTLSPSVGLVRTLGESLLHQSDAIILVYDASSALSFKQLIQWHSELSSDGVGAKGPILVVCNKSDLLRKEGDSGSRRVRVSQRNVMGLSGVDFRGRDWRYEYTAPDNCSRHYEQGKSLVMGKENEWGDKRGIKRKTFLSYNLEGVLWNTDRGYLESIVTSEDGSRPDRDMVLLWCHRNGLNHVEASALDGTGVEHAIELLVTLILGSPSNDNPNDEYERNKQFPFTDRIGKERRAFMPVSSSDRVLSDNLYYYSRIIKGDQSSLTEVSSKVKINNFFQCLFPWCT